MGMPPLPTTSSFAIRRQPTPILPQPRMPLTKAAHYQAYAAASLANAEAAKNKPVREVHLAIARHFYSLAEDEIGLHEEKRRDPAE